MSRIRPDRLEQSRHPRGVLGVRALSTEAHGRCLGRPIRRTHSGHDRAVGAAARSRLPGEGRTRRRPWPASATGRLHWKSGRTPRVQLVNVVGLWRRLGNETSNHVLSLFDLDRVLALLRTGS